MSLLHRFASTAFERLIGDPRLKPIDLKVYGVLWHQPGSSMRATARRSGIAAETFRSSAKRLVELEWAYEAALPNGTAVIPWMPQDTEEQLVDLLNDVRDSMQYLGEWLMRCLLDLLLRDANFIDNARPVWLVTGDGSGRLEVDRWYLSANLAFEFHGSQHYRLGTPFTATVDRLEERQRLDATKAELCKLEGIRLVSIYASDLSFEAMPARLDGLAPVIPVPSGRPLIRFLERQCRTYRNYMARSEREGSVTE